MQRLEASTGHTSPYSFEAALARNNRHKNRYRDILPFDSNRVKLTGKSDYINASLVDDGHRKWIATQGPLEGTIVDFWEMVQQRSTMVVMLCNLNEDGRSKCASYFPDGLDSPVNFHDGECQIHVSCVGKKTDPSSAAVLRKLQLTCSSSHRIAETKMIDHIHFESWPDHDVAATEKLSSLMSLVLNVHGHGKSTEEDAESIIVHCSAGCGRTGTFMALHALLQRPEQDLTALVDHLRKQRIASVQTASQFELLAQFAASRKLVESHS